MLDTQTHREYRVHNEINLSEHLGNLNSERLDKIGNEIKRFVRVYKTSCKYMYACRNGEE